MAQKIHLDLSNDETLDLITNALSSKLRRKIILLSTNKAYSEIELAKILNISISTTSFHLKILKEAGLIRLVGNKDRRGNEKLVYQGVSDITIDLNIYHGYKNKIEVIDIPVGSYFNFSIEPSFTSGLVDDKGLILNRDDPYAFYSPRRFEAHLLYFGIGFVEYRIPIHDIDNSSVDSLTFSIELCSECPMWNSNWKSDITFYFNDVDILTYRSPGDFGDRRGKYTPIFWPSNSSQYGLLKTIRIDSTGSYLDDKKVSDTNINDIDLNSKVVKIKIAVNKNSKYPGGINIFGKGFGDTDQNMILTIAYNKEKKNVKQIPKI